ncbi:DNA topoisomerase IV subunit A [Mycoplasma sp. 1018B]|uniref:DNA topoisomerase IV subunit A n=1 Tax=Mycoplasma sp. 1018B TaxID=2967302 RepID=UPI00211BC538|nr:DNA topoisomerase IV subunit A [Mycoplasma sp. 1018B]UUM19117.1 DNA topoisomerase IV subunit A [Mycoplasma sp. 1018B]
MNKKQEEKLNNLLNKIIQENLDSIISDRFSRYSKYIIQQRALPDIRDGLKPVQRRILYSMYDLGLQYNKAFKKSARVVGDVIGKYHPHGDSSIYEAMVRLSQDWKMGQNLLEMHGNIGSIDDDPPAAMRYTEVRLAKIAQLLLNDLDKNTIKFAPNFDDSEKEPTVLPALIPNLLLNGSKGIASGFATEMPPHNLVEILDAAIAKIKDPYISLNKLMKYIKGPDFPTGGIIHGTQGIVDAFSTGKGKITLTSKYHIWEDNKNKYIEITEIPYGVVKSKLVKDIDLIILNDSLSGLLEIKDQSDRQGISILLTLELKANENIILNYLMQKTEMKIYYNYNNVAIKNYSPELLNLNELLDGYLNHLKYVKIQALNYDLIKFKTRLEIVLGFIKVAEITDQIIKVIRESENSKSGVVENLVKHFEFTLNQANAIAELKLYKLSKTDKTLFLKEKEELEKQIAHYQLLLNDENEFNNWLIQILKSIQQEYGSERKTIITDINLDNSYNESDLIKNEKVYLSVSSNGYLKRFSEKIKQSNQLNNFAIQENDSILFYDSVNTLDNILFFTNLGNYLQVPVYKILETRWKDIGIHLSNFVDLKNNEKIVSIINAKNFKENFYVAMITKNALGKRVELKDFEITRFNKSYTAIKLSDDDELIGAKLTNGLKDILIITKKNLISRYSENDIQIYGLKTNGTKSCNLSLDDEISTFGFINSDSNVCFLTNNNTFKIVNCNEIQKTNKKNLGKKLFETFKYNQIHIIGCEIYNPNRKIFIVTDNNEFICKNISDLELGPANNSGFKKIKHLNIKKALLISDFNTSFNSIQQVENKYFKETKDEKIVLEKATKDIDDALSLDIDEILKRLNIK